MDRRSPDNIVADNIAAAQDAAGVQLDLVRELPREITFGDLLDIGGVLSVSPAAFLVGVPSA